MGYLIGLGCDIVLGVIILQIIAAKYPERLIDDEKNFRYVVATLVVFFWPGSLIYFAFWAITWPARKKIEQMNPKTTEP